MILKYMYKMTRIASKSHELQNKLDTDRIRDRNEALFSWFSSFYMFSWSGTFKDPFKILWAVQTSNDIFSIHFYLKGTVHTKETRKILVTRNFFCSDRAVSREPWQICLHSFWSTSPFCTRRNVSNEFLDTVIAIFYGLNIYGRPNTGDNKNSCSIVIWSTRASLVGLILFSNFYNR